MLSMRSRVSPWTGGQLTSLQRRVGHSSEGHDMATRGAPAQLNAMFKPSCQYASMGSRLEQRWLRRMVSSVQSPRRSKRRGVQQAREARQCCFFLQSYAAGGFEDAIRNQWGASNSAGALHP